MEASILVTVRYTVKEGLRDTFYQQIVEQGIDTASRAEAGNYKYDYYYPLDSDRDICLLEIWSDAEAQKAHAETPHYQQLSKLKAAYVEQVQLKSYSIG
ncbi:MAG: antibiotic biosynthesis monooxygenase [Clostridia bacterium]|nr:antibiotic biosynthesis monooxygenase [Clostridia bacterium]